MPGPTRTLVDAVASQTADARLVYLFGSSCTAHERHDSDLEQFTAAVLAATLAGASD